VNGENRGALAVRSIRLNAHRSLAARFWLISRSDVASAAISKLPSMKVGQRCTGGCGSMMWVSSRRAMWMMWSHVLFASLGDRINQPNAWTDLEVLDDVDGVLGGVMETLDVLVDLEAVRPVA
jgi:hypothetical protein